MISIHLYPIYGKVTGWPSIIPFLAFPKEVRKIIYTINSIEPVNRQIRKIIKNKQAFPNDKSIKKLIYLALRNATKKQSMPIKN